MLDLATGLWGRVARGVRAGIGPTMPPVMADLVFGTITWSSDLGRPATGALHEGFKVVHRYLQIESTVNPDGTVTTHEAIKEIGAPVPVDGTSGPGEFRVNFFDQFYGKLGEGFDVALANVAWEGGTPFEGTREVKQTDPPPPLDPNTPSGVKTGLYPAPAIVVYDVTVKPHIPSP